jgi:hypothetical protein
MLSFEKLKGNEKLKDLSDDILKIIEMMSQNDEDDVIGKKVKEIHTQYDDDIFQITGKRKEGGEKTYDFLKGLLDEGKGVGKLKGERRELMNKIESLEEKLKSGNGVDEELKGKIDKLERMVKDKDSELNQLKSVTENEKNELIGKVGKLESDLFNYKIGQKLSKAEKENGIEWLGSIPESILNETLESRRNRMLSGIKIDPDYEDRDGRKIEVLRDQNGDVIRNAKEGFTPHTIESYWLEMNSDLIDSGKRKKGTGGGGSGGSGGGLLDLSGVKTMFEADDIIRNHIIKVEGIPTTDHKFGERFNELRDQNNVISLPINEKGDVIK